MISDHLGHSKQGEHSEIHHGHGSYYVPDYSWWPILAAVGLFLLGLGSVEYFGATNSRPTMIIAGVAILLFVIIGWFASVITESRAGLYDAQMHRTYRWGMVWFIVADLALVLGLLGALWYYRLYSLQELAGNSPRVLTHLLLWPDFTANWPLLTNPDPSQFPGPKATYVFQWPIINSTIVLLISALTLYAANAGLKTRRPLLLITGLIGTFCLGVLFLFLKTDDIRMAVTHYGILMSSGIYGSIMLMLLSIYLLNLIVVLLMLLVIFVRSLFGHFTTENHFAFTAFNWYWNFLLISWVLIFFSIY